MIVIELMICAASHSHSPEFSSHRLHQRAYRRLSTVRALAFIKRNGYLSIADCVPYRMSNTAKNERARQARDEANVDGLAGKCSENGRQMCHTCDRVCVRPVQCISIDIVYLLLQTMTDIECSNTFMLA